MDDSGFDADEPIEVPGASDQNVYDLGNLPRVDLGDVLREFDPVSVGTDYGHEYIVVTPKGGPDPDFPDTRQLATLRQRHGSVAPDAGNSRTGIGQQTGRQIQQPEVDFATGQGVSNEKDLTSELGSAVASPWTSWTRREYNRDLLGLRGLQVYDKMRKSDGTVRGTLRLAKTPVLAGQWGIKPASDSTRDKNVADFCWNCLQLWMSTSWPQFLTEALLMLDFGYYMFEKVFTRGSSVSGYTGPPGRIIWKKFAPRHPMDVKEWYYDRNGGPLSVDMWGDPAITVPQFEGGMIQANQQTINIPINKLLVFSYDKEAGNIEGISVLRTAYKHWYYKDNLYKIDAIQKERHGIGVPVIQLPVGYSPSDKTLADQLGRNLRTNERAHVVLPPNWIMSFAELKGQPVSCLESINHHDQMIPSSILGRFMTKENSDIEQQHTLFLKATRFTADIVVDVMNKYAIPQLVSMNWSRVGFPQLYARRIGEQEDWRTESFTLRNYVGAGIIVPDQPLEDAIREEMGYPKADPDTARVVKAPQGMNPQQIAPAPTELPGPGHVVDPAQTPGAPPTPNQPAPGAPAPPAPPRVGPPRQGRPSTTPPSSGRGDSSGSSGRRGQ
jgi:hypothetical protein